MVCEKGIFEAKAISNMLIPLPQIVLEKTKMYYTNYHKTNHNVETYRVKIKEDHVPTFFEVTTQHIKIQRPMKYSYHVCDDTGHKIIDCLKYNDMQNMFKNKIVKPEISCGRTQGFKSFSPYGGCEYGHHQEQGH